MRRTEVFPGLSLLVLAGCAPVDQAALVYASKVQVGIHAGSGTAEQPGVELSLGYKQHDVAFVPVMAGRHCPKDADCTDPAHAMAIILGQNMVTDQSSEGDQGLADAKADLESAKAAYEKARADLDKADQDASQYRAALGKLKRSSAPSEDEPGADAGADAPAGDQASEGEEDTEDAAKIAAAEKALDDQLGALADLRANREVARSRVESAADRYATLQQIDRKLEDGDRKTDALSVYGRFNGASDTGIASEQNGMKVELGKIFSTGIAAQNLTQGMSRATCLEAGLALVAATKGGDADALAADRVAIAKSVAGYCREVAQKD